jgi:hypothetical protein
MTRCQLVTVEALQVSDNLDKTSVANSEDITVCDKHMPDITTHTMPPLCTLCLEGTHIYSTLTYMTEHYLGILQDLLNLL